MPPTETKYETNANPNSETRAESKPIELNQTSLEFRLGRLDVSMTSLEKKVDGSLELKKWFTIALITILGTIVAIIFGASNLINNNLNFNREAQKDYYQLLIQVKSEVTDSILNLEKKNTCLQKDSYWEFKNCSNELSPARQ